jgi:hypothetical protein
VKDENLLMFGPHDPVENGTSGYISMAALRQNMRQPYLFKGMLSNLITCVKFETFKKILEF